MKFGPNNNRSVSFLTLLSLQAAGNGRVPLGFEQTVSSKPSYLPRLRRR